MGNLISEFLPDAEEDAEDELKRQLLRGKIRAEVALEQSEETVDAEREKLAGVVEKIKTAHTNGDTFALRLYSREYVSKKRALDRLGDMRNTQLEVLSHLTAQGTYMTDVMPGLNAVSGAMEYTREEMPAAEQKRLLTELEQGINEMNTMAAGISALDGGTTTSGGGDGRDGPNSEMAQVLSELNLNAQPNVLDDLQVRFNKLREDDQLHRLEVPSHDPK